MSSTRPKIAVIALGRIGRIHLQNLHRHFPEVEAVAVSGSESGRNFARGLGVSEVYPKLEAVLGDGSVGAVALCTPTDTHAGTVDRLISAGKHIFCEKPLSLSFGEIRRLDEQATRAGVKLMVAFNRRFDPDFRHVREQVAAGRIGIPHLMVITSRDPAPPPVGFIKGSGGLFMDQAIHDFDMARFILGSEVEEVYARGAVLVDPVIGAAGDIDTAVTTLTCESGTIVTINNSRRAVYGYDQRLEVFGPGGMLRVGNHFTGHLTFFDEKGGHIARPLDFFLERYAASYREEMRAFLDAWLNDGPVPVGAEDALRATSVALAAGLSVKENRPVKVVEVFS